MAAPKLGKWSTALEAIQGWDGAGKVAIVTGGNSGIVSRPAPRASACGISCPPPP